jgi:hypothetical protein
MASGEFEYDSTSTFIKKTNEKAQGKAKHFIFEVVSGILIKFT